MIIYTKHGLYRIWQRNLSRSEIKEAILYGQTVETWPRVYRTMFKNLNVIYKYAAENIVNIVVITAYRGKKIKTQHHVMKEILDKSATDRRSN